MTKMPMMKCGHVAQAIEKETGKPACVICVGITDDAMIIADEGEFVTEGRIARCSYYGQEFHVHGYFANECPVCAERHRESGVARCYCERPSSTDLAFFCSHPDQKYDEFYCGCGSWD